MEDFRRPRLNMRDQKLKMGDFRRPRPNVGDQKSPELPLDLTVYMIYRRGVIISRRPYEEGSTVYFVCTHYIVSFALCEYHS